jgi:hypothetical protein
VELGRRIYRGSRGSRELGSARGCRLKQPHRLVDEYFTEYLFLPMVYNIIEVSSYCFLYIKLHTFSPTLSNFSSAKLHPKCRDAVIYRVAFRAKGPGCRVWISDVQGTVPHLSLLAMHSIYIHKSFINIRPVIALSSPQTQNETAAKNRYHHALSMAGSTPNRPHEKSQTPDIMTPQIACTPIRHAKPSFNPFNIYKLSHILSSLRHRSPTSCS